MDEKNVDEKLLGQNPRRQSCGVQEFIELITSLPLILSFKEDHHRHSPDLLYQ